MQNPNIQIGFTDAGVVDKPWLLDILCTLNENHPYFDKNYRAQKSELQKNDNDDLLATMVIDDPNGYFSNLPQLHSGKKAHKRKGRNIFLTKDQRIELKAKRLDLQA